MRTAGLLSISLSCVLMASGCDPFETLGPSGGTVTSSDDRLSVELPSKALKRHRIVEVFRVDDAPSAALSQRYAVEPLGQHLEEPAIVTFDLEGLEDFGAEDLAIYVDTTEGWRELIDAESDVEQQELRGTVGILSSFVVMPREGFEAEVDPGLGRAAK